MNDPLRCSRRRLDELNRRKAVVYTDAPFFDGAPQIQGLLRAGVTAEELRAIERDNTVRIVPRLSA